MTADQYRTFQLRHTNLVLVHPYIEPGAGDTNTAVSSLDHEWVFAVMADSEECLTFIQGNPALRLVVAVGQFAAKVQFDLAAIGQGDVTHMALGLEVFIGTW